MIYAGCDLGTISAKAVIIENGNILAVSVLPYKSLPRQAAVNVMENVLTDAGLTKDRIAFCLSTGFGKKAVPYANGDIPELIASFQGSVVTDLSPAQMSQMACLLPKLSDENIIFGGIPQEELTQSRQWDERQGYNTFVWGIDNELVRDYINRFEAGTWPVSDGTTGSCPPPVEVGQ